MTAATVFANTFVIHEWWGPWNELSRFTIAMQQSIFDSIRRWNSAFEPLWKKLKSEKCSARLPALQLHLQTKSLTIALVIAGIEDEAGFDNYEKDFLDITNFAEYILANSKSTNHNFILDSNIVYPLLLTANKCRNMIIRRRAISLLSKYPRREVVWDSLFCGKLAQWVMDLKEQYLENDHVPGWARIRGITVQRDGSDNVSLICLQRTSETSEEVVREGVIYECGSLSM